jgi:hypothetical protein
MLKKKESKIDGWKIIEIMDLDEDEIQKTNINDLSWYLITKGIISIWWKDGYYAYFNSGGFSRTDVKEKTIVSDYYINGVLYLKKEYHKYLEIDNETFKVKFVDAPRINTTEKTYVAVFNFNSAYMSMILDAIKNKEEKK